MIFYRVDHVNYDEFVAGYRQCDIRGNFIPNTVLIAFFLRDPDGMKGRDYSKPERHPKDNQIHFDMSGEWKDVWVRECLALVQKCNSDDITLVGDTSHLS